MKKLLSDLSLAEYAGFFSNAAFKTGDTKGRISKIDDWLSTEENEFYLSTSVANPFFCDRHRICHSDSFVISQGKSKVFLNHLSDYRLLNNQRHAYEVAFLAGEICRFLGLNDVLAEAIALGHDLGYPPLGPVGVKVLSHVYGKKFKHASAGVTILQEVENFGLGLNLCYETLLGIKEHSFGKRDFTFDPGLPLEIIIVAIVDKFSFVFGDIKDGLTCGYFKTRNDLPENYSLFGFSIFGQWQTCISALVRESIEKNTISFVESDEAKRFNELRIWSYENFYYKIDQEDYRVKLYSDLLQGFYFLQACVEEKKLDPAAVFISLSNKEAKKLIADAKKGETPSINLLKDCQFLKNIRDRKVSSSLDVFKEELNVDLFRRWED